MRGFVAGAATAIAVFVVAGMAAVWLGWLPAGADNAYLPLERWAAKRTLAANIAREEPQPPYPFGPVTVVRSSPVP